MYTKQMLVTVHFSTTKLEVKNCPMIYSERYKKWKFKDLHKMMLICTENEFTTIDYFEYCHATLYKDWHKAKNIIYMT